jgi:hypothetical protein
MILDGFDLGIGILFLFTDTERQRDQMMVSIAPFWDGNETSAGARRRRIAGRVPWRLRGDHAGVLSAHHRQRCWRWCSAASPSSSAT